MLGETRGRLVLYFIEGIFRLLTSVRLTLPFLRSEMLKEPQQVSSLPFVKNCCFQYPCICPEECPRVYLLSFPQVQTLLENSDIRVQALSL